MGLRTLRELVRTPNTALSSRGASTPPSSSNAPCLPQSGSSAPTPRFWGTGVRLWRSALWTGPCFVVASALFLFAGICALLPHYSAGITNPGDPDSWTAWIVALCTVVRPCVSPTLACKHLAARPTSAQ